MFASLVLLVAFAGASHGQSTGQGLASRGEVANGPLGLFPEWYMDKQGTALEGCMDGPPNCLSTLADLGNPAIGEAFYWSAAADLTHPNGANGFLEYALEMAFLNPTIDAANAMIFNRLRVRIFALPAAGQYTVLHPFGQHVFTAEADGDGAFEINETFDIPGSAGEASFTGVLAAPHIGPFLRQTTRPAGFLGTPAAARTITGGPSRNNVSVTGPGGFTMTQNLFAVEGKFLTNGGLSGTRANYSRAADGSGTIRIHANSVNGQRIGANVGAIGDPARFGVRLSQVAGDPGHYFAARNFTAAQPFEPIRVQNLTDPRRPNQTLNNVPDVVSIRSATWSAGQLTVRALSSDAFNPRPRLQLIAPDGTVLFQRRGSFTVTVPVAVKPNRIRVTSAAGGTATSVVRNAP